ncbi:hypothetical protein FOCC_FOCC015160 [Frankliniella occidentalis]|nr:hypothetical protein FOCC_FOCC015160 [Frankliniella occidentalis]
MDHVPTVAHVAAGEAEGHGGHVENLLDHPNITRRAPCLRLIDTWEHYGTWVTSLYSKMSSEVASDEARSFWGTVPAVLSRYSHLPGLCYSYNVERVREPADAAALLRFWEARGIVARESVKLNVQGPRPEEVVGATGGDFPCAEPSLDTKPSAPLQQDPRAASPGSGVAFGFSLKERFGRMRSVSEGESSGENEEVRTLQAQVANISTTMEGLQRAFAHEKNESKLLFDSIPGYAGGTDEELMSFVHAVDKVEARNNGLSTWELESLLLARLKGQPKELLCSGGVQSWAQARKKLLKKFAAKVGELEAELEGCVQGKSEGVVAYAERLQKLHARYMAAKHPDVHRGGCPETVLTLVSNDLITRYKAGLTPALREALEQAANRNMGTVRVTFDKLHGTAMKLERELRSRKGVAACAVTAAPAAGPAAPKAKGGVANPAPVLEGGTANPPAGKGAVKKDRYPGQDMVTLPVRTVVAEVETAEDANLADWEEWQDHLDKAYTGEVSTAPFLSKFDLSHLPVDERERVGQTLEAHKDAFIEDGKLAPPTPVLQYRVNVDPSIRPVFRPPYGVSKALEDDYDEEIRKWLALGVIEEANSPWAAPISMVTRVLPSGKVKKRLVCDLRAQNAHTLRDNFPPPNMNEILNSLHGANYISVFDVSNAYLCVEIHPDSRDFFGLVTKKGTYRCKRMIFGAKNSGAVYCRLMAKVMENQRHCKFYVDDLIIYTETLELHLEVLGKRAFDALRTALCDDPVMALPDWSVKEFIIRADSSGYAIGGALSQVQRGAERIILYYSRKLTVPETRTNVTEKEALAIVETVRHCAWYLQGNKVKIYTDHRPLSFLGNYKGFGSPKITRWAIYLSQFDVEFLWIKGIENSLADGLSRSGEEGEGGAPDARGGRELPSPPASGASIANPGGTGAGVAAGPSGGSGAQDNMSLVPAWQAAGAWGGESDTAPEVLRVAAVRAQPINDKLHLVPNYAQYRACYENDPDFGGMFRELSTGLLQSSDYKILDGLLYKCAGKKDKGQRVCVPLELREGLMHAYHYAPWAGHSNYDGMYGRIRERWYWPNMTKDIYAFAGACHQCALRKRGTHGQPAPLQEHVLPTRPFQYVSCDVVGPLPVSVPDEYRYIVTFICLLTKFTEAVPVRSQATEDVARAFVNQLVARYGVPDYLLTDNGACYISEMFGHVTKLLGVTHLRCTPLRPQAQGSIERSHRTLGEALSMYVNSRGNDWPEFLQLVAMSMRSAVNRSTGETPYFLLTGFDMRLPYDLLTEPVTPRHDLTDNLAGRLQSDARRTFRIVRERMRRAARASRTYYNKRAKVPKFELGNLVYLLEKSHKKGVSRKFRKRYSGPWRLEEKRSPTTWRLKRVYGRKERVVHSDRLKIARGFDDVLSAHAREQALGKTTSMHTGETPTRRSARQQTAARRAAAVSLSEDEWSDDSIPEEDEEEDGAVESDSATEEDVEQLPTPQAPAEGGRQPRPGGTALPTLQGAARGGQEPQSGEVASAGDTGAPAVVDTPRMIAVFFFLLCGVAATHPGDGAGAGAGAGLPARNPAAAAAVELIGFHCAHAESEVSTISLDNVGSCPPPSEYGSTKRKSVQILQAREFERVHVRTCYVKVIRHITYCGQGSHSAQVKGGLTEDVQLLGRDACRSLHMQGSMVHSGLLIADIKPNSTRFASMTVVGSVDAGASCKGGSINVNGLSYDDVLVMDSVTIRLTDYWTVVDSGSKMLKLRTGDTCEFAKQYCIQFEAGEVVWEAEPQGDCRKNGYDVVYQEQSEFGFAFEMDETMPQNVDTLAYYATKASAMELNSMKRTSDLQMRAIYERCLARRDLLLTKLALARRDPEPLIKLIKGEIGYSGIVYGDVLFLTKCKPVPVMLKNDSRCYQQIPVVWQGHDYFLARSSKVLVPYGEHVPCDDFLTPTFRIRGEWMAFTPQF